MMMCFDPLWARTAIHGIGSEAEEKHSESKRVESRGALVLYPEMEREPGQRVGRALHIHPGPWAQKQKQIHVFVRPLVQILHIHFILRPIVRDPAPALGGIQHFLQRLF